MISITSPKGEMRYRNDPYSLDLLPSDSIHDQTACIAFNCNKSRTPKSTPPPASAGSELSGSGSFQFHASPMSKNGSLRRSNNKGVAGSPSSAYSPAASSTRSNAKNKKNNSSSDATDVKYATVKFKFASAMFIAPFRCVVGDRVVCECDGKTESLGVVEAITTIPPPSNQQHIKYKLIRHARTKDLDAYSQCVYGEGHAIEAAHQIFREREIDATIVDCEWQLDKTCFIAMVHFNAFPNQHNEAEYQLAVDAVNRSLVELFVCRVFVMPVMAPSTPEANHDDLQNTTNSSFVGGMHKQRPESFSQCNSSLRETATSASSFRSSRSTSQSVTTPPPEPLLCAATLAEPEQLGSSPSSIDRVPAPAPLAEMPEPLV